MKRLLSTVSCGLQIELNVQLNLNRVGLSSILDRSRLPTEPQS
jgi:hypothetical protein